MSQPVKLPKTGRSKHTVLSEMESLRDQDVRWKEGKVFSLVFYPGQEILDLLKDAYNMYFSENGLNPSAFPSLRILETEVVSMTADLLNGKKAAGNLTTGGTESILMAIKTAREWARHNRPEIKEPEIIVPVSAHPAFDKGAHYFGVRLTHIPVLENFEADVSATKRAINKNTIMLVGSAPSYPQGVLDPITELAALARKNKILMHVDACVGGFMLPWLKRLKYPLAAFDFKVPGVTSMSVDLHKYAYAAKGASVILYRDAALRRYQYFVTTEWPGGIYASPSMAGTRSGGSIAAAWAIMNHLGQAGYLRINRAVMEASLAIKEGVNAIPGLIIFGKPVSCVMAIGSEDLDIYAVGDEMSVRGWHMDRQQNPASLHLTISFAHTLSKDQFLADLAESTAIVRKRGKRSPPLVAMAGHLAGVLPEPVFSKIVSIYTKLQKPGLPKRSAAMYGMMGSLPERGNLEEVIKDILEKLTTPGRR